MARFVAWNIDGANLKKYSRNGLSFKYDDRIPKYLQIGNEVYKENNLDRGHIARRADLVWGSPGEAQAGNRESFYFTNITPQHQRFNQSERAGLWGLLENAIYEDVDIDNLRLSVMGGPVLKDDDMKYRGIKVPDEFWKALIYVQNGNLKAKAYILSQADYLNDIEALELDEFRLWQVTLADLGMKVNLDFGVLTAADTLEAERVRRPEMVSPSGRLAREIVRREDLFLR
jgi:endonuclease G